MRIELTDHGHPIAVWHTEKNRKFTKNFLAGGQDGGIIRVGEIVRGYRAQRATGDRHFACRAERCLLGCGTRARVIPPTFFL